MSEEKNQDSSSNTTWHCHTVSREERWKVNNGNSCGAVLWFTGLSGSGKSSIANEVDFVLNQKRKVSTYLLDGDNIRHGLCKDLGFSANDRAENIRRIGEVAKLMFDAGMIVIVAFISPYRSDRDSVRNGITQMISEHNTNESSKKRTIDNVNNASPFVEIFVKASLQTCESRDPKGLYKMAREGKIKNFTGISDPYEEPLNAEIVLDSDEKSVEELSNEVVSWLNKHQIIH